MTEDEIAMEAVRLRREAFLAQMTGRDDEGEAGCKARCSRPKPQPPLTDAVTPKRERHLELVKT